MKANATIAETEVKDVSELKRLIAGVIVENVTHDQLIHSEMTANALGNVDWWTAHGSGVHLKATLQSRIVGVVLVKEYWNLCSLFVATATQRQGIGGQLLSSAIAACAGKSPFGAVLLNSAPTAISFYARYGFKLSVPSRPLPSGFAAMEFRLNEQQTKTLIEPSSPKISNTSKAKD